jgi:hypothetical protein
MGWNDIPKPKPTLPGEWEAFMYGTDYRGWILRCGPGFNVQIHRSGDQYFTSFNSVGLQVQGTLLQAQVAAELAIVNGIREMLPGYKVIVERLEARHKNNIISIKPKD